MVGSKTLQSDPERFGYLPITEDSHFGEYVHWAYDVVDHKGILDFYNYYKAWLPKAEAKIQLQLSERVVPIIEGIETDAGSWEEAVNVPNAGLIDDLPAWLSVEVPATVDATGVHGVNVGPLPEPIAAMCRTQIAVQDRAIEAAAHGDRNAALQALLLDPVVNSISQAEAILKELLEVHKDFLPQFS